MAAKSKPKMSSTLWMASKSTTYRWIRCSATPLSQTVCSEDDDRALEQVFALIKGTKSPDQGDEVPSEVRLSVRTPLKAEEVKLDDKGKLTSTKKMYNDETDEYEKCWADKFNDVINELRGRTTAQCSWWCCGSSGWGDGDPFVRTMQMSVTDQWNDMYLAHAYPFLYARKLHYAFANHTWERFLLSYGKMGLHIFVLIFLTLLIVGGYRTFANCDRFARSNSTFGIFATQVRPKSSMPLYLLLNLYVVTQACEFCIMQCALLKRGRWTQLDTRSTAPSSLPQVSSFTV
jgi:hypothetical protein